MARANQYRQDITATDGAVVIQRAGSVTLSRGRDILRRIEDPELYYLPPRPRRVVPEAEQESNIERKMKKFGDDEVIYAQQRRADILVILQRMSSLSEFSQEHLEWIMRNLEDWYRRIYVATVRVNGDEAGIAYQNLLDRLDEFAEIYDHDRLPLNYNILVSLLYNATGLCDIDWKIPRGNHHEG